MKVRKIDHIGIAVKNLEEARGLYETVLGLSLGGIEEIPERNIRVAFFQCGETEVELVEPLSFESAVAKFMEQYGEGFYHLALEVEDIGIAVARLNSLGLKIKGGVPSAGARGSKIGFLDMADTKGVMIELIEKG